MRWRDKVRIVKHPITDSALQRRGTIPGKYNSMFERLVFKTADATTIDLLRFTEW